jgi:hypothetical protein
MGVTEVIKGQTQKWDLSTSGMFGTLKGEVVGL